MFKALIRAYYERKYPPAMSVYVCPSCGQHFHNRDWVMPIRGRLYHATLYCIWERNPDRRAASGTSSEPYLTIMEGVPRKYAEGLSRRPHMQTTVQK